MREVADERAGVILERRGYVRFTFEIFFRHMLGMFRHRFEFRKEVIDRIVTGSTNGDRSIDVIPQLFRLLRELRWHRRWIRH